MKRLEFDLFKKKLLEMKSDLINASATFRNETRSRPGGPGDDADSAASEINLNLYLRLQERDRLLVQKIDRALAKIECGTYGECESCGELLSGKRLIARPFSLLCIECKEEREHRNRHFA